jgi:hypothetical protein
VDSGFVRLSGNPTLFLVGQPKVVTPAFYCSIFKRAGAIQLGGGVGLFVHDFEIMWRDSLSKEDARLDATLPLIRLVDNYLELSDGGALRFYDIENIKIAGQQIYDLVRQLPSSLDELAEALEKGKLLDHPVSDYLHIFDYYDDGNIYFRKSSRFVYWFIDAFPQLSTQLLRCLSASQLRRLGLS